MVNSEPMKEKGKTIKHPHTDIATIRHVPWKKGESKYEIYIFKKYSPTAKAQRLYRKTERDAKDYVNALANERKSFGSYQMIFSRLLVRLHSLLHLFQSSGIAFVLLLWGNTF